jgi:hypothetical protein
MKHRILSFLASLTLISTLGFVLAPISAEAALTKSAAKKKVTVVKKAAPKVKLSVAKISGVDEKEILVTTTRCLTKDMIRLNDKTTKLMETDIAKYGKQHPAAGQRYRERVELSWAAMAEPYCGFGSMGMTAVKHSYNKGVQRARADFLAATKKK